MTRNRKRTLVCRVFLASARVPALRWRVLASHWCKATSGVPGGERGCPRAGLPLDERSNADASPQGTAASGHLARGLRGEPRLGTIGTRVEWERGSVELTVPARTAHPPLSRPAPSCCGPHRLLRCRYAREAHVLSAANSRRSGRPAVPDEGTCRVAVVSRPVMVDHPLVCRQADGRCATAFVRPPREPCPVCWDGLSQTLLHFSSRGSVDGTIARSPSA